MGAIPELAACRHATFRYRKSKIPYNPRNFLVLISRDFVATRPAPKGSNPLDFKMIGYGPSRMR